MFHLLIRPTLDSVEKGFDFLRKLFRDNEWSSFSHVGRHRVGHSANLFANEQWEDTRQSIVTPGFRLSDHRQVDLSRKFFFKDYVGQGTRGFSLTLSLTWKLNEGGVSFEPTISGEPVRSAGYLVDYSAMAAHVAEVDRTVEAISQAMMTEIARRSKEVN